MKYAMPVAYISIPTLTAGSARQTTIPTSMKLRPRRPSMTSASSVGRLSIRQSVADSHSAPMTTRSASATSAPTCQPDRR